MPTMSKPTTTDLNKSMMDVVAAYAEWSRVLPGLSREEAFDLFSRARIPLFEGAELRVVFTGAVGEAAEAGRNNPALETEVQDHEAADPGPAHATPAYSARGNVPDTGSDTLDQDNTAPPGLTRAGSVSDTSITEPPTPIYRFADLPLPHDFNENYENYVRNSNASVAGGPDEELGRLERERRRLDGSPRNRPGSSRTPDHRRSFDPSYSAPLNDNRRSPTPTSEEGDAYEDLLDVRAIFRATERDMSPPLDFPTSPPGFSTRSSSKRASPSPEEEDEEYSPKRRRTPDYRNRREASSPPPAAHSNRRRSRNRTLDREHSPPVASSSRFTPPPSPRRGSTWDRRRSRHGLTLSPGRNTQPSASSSRHRLPSPRPRYPSPGNIADDERSASPSDTRRSAERYYGDHHQHDTSSPPPPYEVEDEGDQRDPPERLYFKMHHDDCRDLACVDECPVYVPQDECN